VSLGPGTSSQFAAGCGSEHCITCGDDGVPMVVVALDESRGLALCDDGDDERCTVETALVTPVALGDRLLVHAGTAIASLEHIPA
jgi:hydrogenase maturation factor